MNIYDISDKAGVSIATVSRVINGHSKVSPKTREKVLKVMADNGYTPNAFARGLGLNSMNTIGIMCADSSDPFMAKAISYLEKALRDHNYDVRLSCTGFNTSNKSAYLDNLLDKRTDAIILVGSNFVEASDRDNAYIRKAAEKVPIMLLNGAMSGTNIYATLCDDHAGIFNAMTMLIEEGRKHIHYLYNAHSYSGNHKLSGFNAALKGRDQITAHTHYIDGSISEAKALLSKLHQEGIPIDGVLASDDSLAIGALKFANDAKLNVPEDLSIIGYNNSLIATCCQPELTSVDTSLESLCHTCVTNLMRVFNHETVASQTIFSSQLILRGTTR